MQIKKMLKKAEKKKIRKRVENTNKKIMNIMMNMIMIKLKTSKDRGMLQNKKMIISTNLNMINTMKKRDFKTNKFIKLRAKRLINIDKMTMTIEMINNSKK